MAGHGGGAWKVAYADFVTAMMAFFMVMWITAQSKQVKEAVAHYFNTPMIGPSDAKGDKTGQPVLIKPDDLKLPEVPDPRLQLSPTGVSRRYRADKPNLAILHDGKNKVDGAIVPFEESAAELDSRAKDQLDKLVPLLLGKRFKIEVRGHATRRPMPPGSPHRNAWDLSYARCVATMNYMIAAGIEPDCIRLSQAGAFEPSTLRVELAKQGLNSRVEVYALNEVADELVGTREEREERFKVAAPKPGTERQTKASAGKPAEPSASAKPAGDQRPKAAAATGERKPRPKSAEREKKSATTHLSD